VLCKLDHLLHEQPTDSMALESRAHHNSELGVCAACIIVQAHHVQHPSGVLLDGNEGHSASGIVMEQFVDQVFAHRVHRRKEAQPQVLGVSRH